MNARWIVYRTLFIYKYKTYTLTPFVKPRNILNLAIQNVFNIQLYVESAFTYNLGMTKKVIRQFETFKAFKKIKIAFLNGIFLQIRTCQHFVNEDICCWSPTTSHRTSARFRCFSPHLSRRHWIEINRT